jgi:hypothetical protein
MSLIQQIPEGLKPQEVERGNGRVNPPIPYVPEKIDEIDPDRKVPTIKIELSNGVESRVDLWEGIGTSEQFLCHMMSVREGIEGMGLFSRHEEAEAKVSELKKQLKKAKDSKDATAKELEASVCEANKACFRDALNDSVDAIKKLKTELAAAKEECNGHHLLHHIQLLQGRRQNSLGQDRLGTNRTRPVDESPWCGAVRRPRQNTRGMEGLFHPHAEDSICKQRSRAAKVLSYLSPLQSQDTGACVPPEVHDARRLRLGAPWHHSFQGCDGYDQGGSPVRGQ